MAFDAEDRLYVAASLGGRKGVVRISADRKPELFLSGPGIVGLAFTPSRSLVVATTNALYRVDVGIKGRPLRCRAMNAEIIAVGSELLTPQRLDTNSLYLTDQLNALGVEVTTKYVVGDDRERLATSVRRALANAEIVILSGGLGPTEDDVTRDAVALALDRKLMFHAEITDQLEQRFRQAEPQDGGSQPAPGVHHRRRRDSAQRPRHRARAVDRRIGTSPSCSCPGRRTS